MEREKRRHAPLIAVISAAIIFILFANAGDGGLPVFLQRPVDSANNALGGVIFPARYENSSGLSVYILDVGQGDSIFVRLGGSCMLIDGGLPEEGATVENFLRSQGITTLDYVVATHPHSDHIGGLSAVIRDFKVKKIIMTDAAATTSIFENLLTAIKQRNLTVTRALVGDSYSLGGASFTILAPDRKNDDLNEMSVVIRLCYKKRSFLLTGDASRLSETDMLSSGRTLAADVLKVGHHGSVTATTPDFLTAVGPKYAVISAGAGNSYGLPDEATIDRLEAAGVKVFRTDRDGTVVFYTDGDKLTYKLLK